ncbi:MAG: hypothetical protein GY763_07205, partial [Gammaproteobacteria bacterium]|nr:hypothetical protein [Gammaproteobacteria bacterium]
MIRSFLFLLPLLISQFSLFAAEPVELEIELDLDLVFNISHFKGNSSRLIIWLPSEHGVSRGMSSVAGKISELNSHVWLVDLHSSYMVPASRYSLSEFPISDLMALLSHAEVMGFDEIYLLSAARGAKMVLDM